MTKVGSERGLAGLTLARMGRIANSSIVARAHFALSSERERGKCVRERSERGSCRACIFTVFTPLPTGRSISDEQRHCQEEGLFGGTRDDHGFETLTCRGGFDVALQWLSQGRPHALGRHVERSCYEALASWTSRDCSTSRRPSRSSLDSLKRGI